MIDTHCHINLSPLIEDIEGVWQRAQEAGVSSGIIIGTELNSSHSAIEIANKTLGLFAAVGIHPDVIHPGIETQEIKFDEWENQLGELASSQKVVAIGECGLDYVELHEQSETKAKELKNLQKQLFGIQIKLAKKLDLPLSIHCRNTRKETQEPKHGLNSYLDIFDTLEHFSKDDGVLPRFVLHCMSGNIEYLQKGLKLGGFISFAGNVTYPSAGNLRELLKATPLDRLLLETDAPFLSPQASRGTPNEPAKISQTYEFVAKELGVHLDELDKLTHENAHKLFQKV